MSNLKEKLNKLKGDTPSKWKEDADHRLNNRWLEYSSQIARRIIALIKEDKELNQVKLAKALNVEPQYISRVIQGKENLTLKTIYKLSQALNHELISFPEYEFSQVKKVTKKTKREAKIISLPKSPIVKNSFTKD